MNTNTEVSVTKSNLPKLAALEKLTRTDRTRLYRFILHRVHDPVESEDLAQQAFVEAANSIASFREESGVKTWLYGIASNLIANHLRRAPALRYEFESDEILESMECPRADPRVQLESVELLARLRHHLKALPENMRGTLMMVLLDDVSYEDAAQLLDVPVGTIRSRVSRGRSILKNHLELDGVR
ncbi:MAG: sigma-70 family RNA polymerase sigma factor [Pseudomonadota bacterium]